MYNKNKQNLLDIREAGEKIFSFIEPIHNHEEFNQNGLIFDAAMMNIIIIGESVSRLSEDFKTKNSHIDWIKIKGLRNIIAHDYLGIDVEEVWQIVKILIPSFLDQVDKLLKDI